MPPEVPQSAAAAAAHLPEAEQAIARGGNAVEALLGRLAAGAAESEARLEALRALAGDAQQNIAWISAATGPELIGRANLVAETLAAIAARLSGELPAGLASVEAQAERAREAISPLAPMAEEAGSRVETATRRAIEAEAILVRIGEGAASGESQLESLRASAHSAQQAVSRISEETGPELIGRADRIAETLSGIAARLGDELPAGLSSVEAQAERARAALSPLAPMAEAAESRAGAATARAAEAEAILARIGEGAAASESQLDSLRSAADAAQASVSRIAEQVGPELSARADAVAATLAAIAARLGDELPSDLARIEAQAERTGEMMSPLAPLAAEVQASAEAAAARIAEAEAGIGRQREALDTLLARVVEDSAKGEAHLGALAAAAEAARDTAARITAETGPELIEALLRVRETANQAADRAREAISAVIPQSTAALAEASREAIGQAIGDTVERQMAELGAASDRALNSARQASERLTRQLVAIGETTGAIEARIEEERRGREAQENENFSRRVALLIESLNSTAIDVTKILSNDVTDTAWAAYLKGDRGVFTRRAVRLLDNSEAREIVRHYEEEPEFREQVNRYIHDFESMLRRILADRDGSPLGVTLLSSDMGKLYVALAQAIDRLRT
jgi:hypothetical protein